MGRLPTLGLLVFVAFCNDPAKPSGSARSEQVVSSASIASASASAANHDVAAPRTGPLCDRADPSRAISKTSPAYVDLSGGVSDRAMPHAPNRSVWVSFFASWCGPCKEEIPRIQRFAQKLEHDGVPIDVAFVSIDDDLRQLTTFFGAQPEGGIKSSYWLKDGPPRTAWLASLKMKSDPALPEHALVDAKGRVRCFVSGAIEESDYGALAQSLR